MKFFSKNVNRFYPDLAARGGLANALQSALLEIGSALTVSKLPDGVNFVAYARVESGPRFSQIFTAAEERMFLFDFWARGVMLAKGATPQLTEMARAIIMWVSSSCSTGELSGSFKFVAVEKWTPIFERGEEVEWRWRSYLQDVGYSELASFVEAAARRPQLRQLFPYTSHNLFCFSRCTGYPFTRDTPFVRPMKKGQYEVLLLSEEVLGRGNAEEAADLVVAHLPPNCGPARPGTADDM